MKRLVSLLVCATALLGVDIARSAPAAKPSLRRALSVGAPNEGKLEGGERLQERPYLRMLPGHSHRWGLPQLVGLLDRGAARVNKRFPGSVLGVGDLSRQGGGDVPGHHSHESGRDADVAFFALDRAGKPVRAPRLAAFDEHGHAPGHLVFDDARNWALVEAWMSDPEARVSQIFIASHLRDRLLAYARQQHVSPALRERAAFAMLQPRRGLPHDNHFHVRIACPGNQRSTCHEFAVREQRAPATHPHRAPAVSHAKPARPTARPVVARARKRVGTTGHAAPSLVAVVPAPRDVDF